MTQINYSYLSVNGKLTNGFRYIYKIVDLVNARDQTLITTHHDVMGQESFSVAPWEAIEVVKEGAGSPEGTSPSSGETSSGEASQEHSDGDDESVITAIHRRPSRVGEGEDGEDGMQMTGSMRRRAATDQIDVGHTRRGSFLTGGVNTRRC